MLTAKDEKGTYITLYNLMAKDNISEIKREGIFYCPCCETEVTIKAGKVKIPHFAHKRNSSCNASSEPESDYHLTGKVKLYQWLSKQFPAILEAYIPEINQRADILVKAGTQKYAIEFQCSTIPEESFIKRTDSYRAAGIIPIWIIAERNLKKVRQNEFSLRNFDWMFLTGAWRSPVIIAFCPIKNRITRLEKILPFSPRSTIAYQSFGPLSSLAFQSLFQPSPRRLPFLNIWREKRRSWAFHNVKGAKPSDPFFHSLYVNRLSPITLPPEIGLPIEGMYMIETAAIKWQAYVYIDTLHRKETGENISMNEFIHSYRNRIKSRHIRLRKLPLLSGKDYRVPLENYVSFFRKTGYIEEHKAGYFKVMRKVIIPQTYNQWIDLEKEFYYVHQKLLQNEE